MLGVWAVCALPAAAVTLVPIHPGDGEFVAADEVMVVAAIAGALQPASAKQTISTRSRSAGLRLGSRRNACTAVRSSGVKRNRSIHQIVPDPGRAA